MSAILPREGCPSPRFEVEWLEGDPIAEAVRNGGDPPRSLLQAAVMRLVGPGVRLLDAGAHVGTTALPAARAGAKVVAVEPDPRLAAALRASARASGLASSVEVIEAAMADSAGEVAFSPAGPWGHVRKRSEIDDVDERVPVDAVTGDWIVDRCGWDCLDVIKLNLVGYEPRALRGLARTLTRPPAPLLVLESNAHALRWYGETPASLRAELRRLGYAAFLIDWRNADRLVPLDEDSVQPECVSALICTRAEADAVERGWAVAPFTREELVERLLASCSHASVTDRWNAAREIDRGPSWLRAEPRLAAALVPLHSDPAPMVRDAAAFADGARPGRDSTRAYAGAGRSTMSRLPNGRRIVFELPPAVDTPIARDLLACEDYPLYASNRLLLDMVRRGDRVVDLGAHLGTFALPAAVLGARVLALEPHPGYADLLDSAIERNGLRDRVTLVRAAAGAAGGEVELVLSFEWTFARQPGDRLAGEHARAERVPVAMTTVEAALAEAGWDGADFVKMDVEGFELRALEGMRAVLAPAEGPSVLFESNRPALEDHGASVAELFAALESLGYRLYLVGHEDGASFLTPVTSDDFQPEPAEEMLAVKGAPPAIEGWEMRDPVSRGDIVRRTLRLCRTELRGYRRLLAEALRDDAPGWLLEEPLVVEALGALREDVDPDVRAAAGWSASTRS